MSTTFIPWVTGGLFVFRDDFNRDDGPLGSNYIAGPSIEIFFNGVQLVGGGNGRADLSESVRVFGATQSAQIRAALVTGFHTSRLYLRGGYVAVQWNKAFYKFTIYNLYTGVPVFNSQTQLVFDGDNVSASVQGNNLIVRINGSEVYSGASTDGGTGSGQPGFQISYSSSSTLGSVRMDDFISVDGFVDPSSV